MKILWKISQTANADYDTYSDAIVCAATKEEARKIDPSERRIWHDGVWWFQYADGSEAREYHHNAWVNNIKDVKVERIGIAARYIKLGNVICSSFHTG